MKSFREVERRWSLGELLRRRIVAVKKSAGRWSGSTKAGDAAVGGFG
jgi:hypothetical protein